MEKKRSAIDIYSARPDASSVAIPQQQKRGVITHPIWGAESKAMLDFLEKEFSLQELSRYGLNIKYDALEDLPGANAAYYPLGTIKLKPGRSGAAEASTLSHELVHHAMIMGLDKAEASRLDSLADLEYGGLMKKFGFEYGSTEPMAYRLGEDSPERLKLRPLFDSLKVALARAAN